MAFSTQDVSNSNTLVPVANDCATTHDDVTSNASTSFHNGGAKTYARTKDIMNERVAWTKSAIRKSKDVGPFFAADIGDVWRNYQHFKSALPRVEPHFAVKANPEPMLLQLLSRAGCSFDCASPAEIELATRAGADPATQIVFSHPRVNFEQIIDAREEGVQHFVFDSPNELVEAQMYYPDAKFIIRIAPDDSGAVVKFSEKFGVRRMQSVESLLHEAKSRGIDVVGVHFHVGSDNQNPEAFSSAIKLAHQAFLIGKKVGFNFNILDLGGGYTRERFDETATAIRETLDQYFPPSRDVRVIAEPGRFFVASAFALAVRVTGRKDPEEDDFDDLGNAKPPVVKIDISDGVYGSLANFFQDGQMREPQILWVRDPSTKKTRYLFWGPTCDSYDKPIDDCTLPVVLNNGDWVWFSDQGAYTCSCSTNFNGNDKARIIWTSTEADAAAILLPEFRQLLHYPAAPTAEMPLFVKAKL